MYTFAHTICTLHAHIQETKHRVKCYKLGSHNENSTKKKLSSFQGKVLKNC